MDLHGTLPVSTPEGYWYWHLIVDDYTRIWGLFLLHHKSEAFPAFQRFVHWAENKLGVRVKSAQDDKGGEWMSKEQQQWCIERGIERQHTIRNELHQNGVAGRANQSLANGATSLLVESNLPPSFWGYAVQSFVYGCNRALTSAISLSHTSYTAWFKEKPDVDHLQVFGCIAYSDSKNVTNVWHF
jgi:transposase InsO family protein